MLDLYNSIKNLKVIHKDFKRYQETILGYVYL
jgi:hypothetical protein